MSGWIKAEDEKPEKDVSVIIFPFVHTYDVEFGITGYWNGDTFLNENDEVTLVTHWQPIPEHPEDY